MGVGGGGEEWSGVTLRVIEMVINSIISRECLEFQLWLQFSELKGALLELPGLARFVSTLAGRGICSHIYTHLLLDSR